MPSLKDRLARALAAPLPIHHQMRDEMLAERQKKRQEDGEAYRTKAKQRSLKWESLKPTLKIK